MRTKADIKAELEAHLADLEHFEARVATYVAGSPAEQEANEADNALFRARHAERTAELKAELA